jgi:hypothetical protein
LEVATTNVSEILGRGIIDSLMVLGNDTSVAELATDMETAATNAAKLLVTISKVIKAINTPLQAVSGSLAAFVEKTSPLVNLIVEGDPSGFIKSKPKPFSTGMSVSGQTQTKAVSASSSQTKIAKDTLKINQQSLKLAKARATFDLQKIQIEAALKGKISEEDAIRLKLMKAIEEENLTNIEKYQKALTVAQEKSKELSTLLTTIKLMEVKDPFGLWKIDPITASINELTKSMLAVQTQIQANGKEWSSFSSTVGATVLKPNLTEWTSSFGAAGSAASAAAAAQIKALQDAAAAQTAAITGASAEQKAILEAQLAAQQAALNAANAAALEALKARLAAEVAATKEAADAAQAAAEATFILGTNDSATRNAIAIAAKAAAEAAAAKAALDAASAQATNNGANSSTTTKIEVTVTGDPFTDPNVIAEKIVDILNNAGARGTIELQATA